MCCLDGLFENIQNAKGTIKQRVIRQPNQQKKGKKDECRVGTVVSDRSTEVSVEVNFNPPHYGSPRHCTTVITYIS